MARTLILFAHPALEKSRANKVLIEAASQIDGVTINDLYKEYPDFLIDVEREKALLLENDRIVLQHPFYWYSTPSILKEWFDRVLEYGWAYGNDGQALVGKRVRSVVTAGGSKDAYCDSGYNKYSVEELLRPVEQTAGLCGMEFLAPLVFYGSLHQDEAGYRAWAAEYGQWLASD